MSSPFVEIMLPVSSEFLDEDAFKIIQSSIRQRFIPPPNRKRILVVAMELFLNLKRHASKEHLALLRIRKEDSGKYEISSINFAETSPTENLSKKHAELNLEKDYRQNFKNKLSEKVLTSKKPGNLGLDICFRQSNGSKLRIFPQSSTLALVYISFFLN
jgi:hypothetical protein